MCGVNMRPDDWRELMDLDNSPRIPVPMMWLCHEHDPVPNSALAPEKREELPP
jgi:hypothetical protein